MRRRRGGTDFDLTLTWGERDREISVTGTVDPGCPQKGPTHDCGGTPAEPACIEDLAIVLIHKRKDGTVRRREVPDKSGKLGEALEPAIFELLADDE